MPSGNAMDQWTSAVVNQRTSNGAEQELLPIVGGGFNTVKIYSSSSIFRM